MLKFSKWSVVATSLVIMASVTIGTVQPTLAQGGPGNRPSIPAQAFNACTTTSYADIASKALGITTAVLRKDIVSGQNLQDIATTANVDIKTVNDAVQAARKADVDQAVKDGVLTQDEADAMQAFLRPANGNPPATAPATNGNPPPRPQGQAQGVPFPDISTIRNLLQQLSGATPAANGPRGGGGFASAQFNVLKQYAIAAQPLNVKCADLVKTLITPPGKSIADVAADQKVDVQIVTDALTKAYKDALAQDVTDGIITQAESDQLSPVVDKAVSTFVNNPLPMGLQATPAK